MTSSSSIPSVPALSYGRESIAMHSSTVISLPHFLSFSSPCYFSQNRKHVVPRRFDCRCLVILFIPLFQDPLLHTPQGYSITESVGHLPSNLAFTILVMHEKHYLPTPFDKNGSLHLLIHQYFVRHHSMHLVYNVELLDFLIELLCNTLLGYLLVVTLTVISIQSSRQPEHQLGTLFQAMVTMLQ